MNYRLTLKLLGIVAFLEGAFLAVPAVLAAVKGENFLAFLIAIGICVVVGVPTRFFRVKNKAMRSAGGLLTVALCWIVCSLLGCLPLVLAHKANFLDAFFETVSGFTGTGATVFSDVESLGFALNLWRAMTQWLGGMGILLFVIALLPKTDGNSFQIFRAETPGPKAGKIVSKLSLTARILYLIYLAMTMICVLFLIFGGVPVYDSFVLAFATASTGGFANTALGVGTYASLYAEIVVTVFMFLFSVNFTLHYFVLLGKVREAVRSEELRWFLSLILIGTAIVTVSLFTQKTYATFGECLRYSLFQTVSTISTTGFVLPQDLGQWPVLAQTTLLLLMFCGGCAGSTAGGLKISRVMILSKSAAREVKLALEPNRMVNIKSEGRVVENTVVQGVLRYFLVYILVLIASTVLVTVGNIGGRAVGEAYFSNSLTAVVSAMNNIGPGLFDYASGNFGNFSGFSKAVMIFDMLAGRLEILPLLMLFNPRCWRN